MKFNITAGLLMIAILIGSCNSTKITSSWKAANATNKTYRNIMVWGILAEKDSALRRQMEAHLVNDLVEKGYRAFSSLDVYREKAYKKLTANAIVDEFKSTGVDAVITIVLLNKEKEEQYYPAGFYNQSVTNFSNLDKYSSSVYEKVFTPGYYISSTSYFWEAGLFEVAGNNLMYSMQTRSFDPVSTEMLAHENGLAIVKDMIRKKVIVDKIPATE